VRSRRPGVIGWVLGRAWSQPVGLWITACEHLSDHGSSGRSARFGQVY